VRFTLKEAAALTSQRVLGAWEKLRRADGTPVEAVDEVAKDLAAKQCAVLDAREEANG
jgi:hypothetical protein